MSTKPRFDWKTWCCGAMNMAANLMHRERYGKQPVEFTLDDYLLANTAVKLCLKATKTHGIPPLEALAFLRAGSRVKQVTARTASRSSCILSRSPK